MGFGLENLGDVYKWPQDTCGGDYQPWGRWPVLAKENTGHAFETSFAFCACLSGVQLLIREQLLWVFCITGLWQYQCTEKSGVF